MELLLFLVYGGISIVCLLVWLSRVLVSSSQVRCARQLKAAGDWKGATASYKKAILKRLDSNPALPGLVEELQEIYRANGVQPDFARVLECPRLLKEIWATKIAPGEKKRLTGKIYAEIGRFLDSLP